MPTAQQERGAYRKMALLGFLVGGDLVLDSARKRRLTTREAFAVSEAKPRTANDSSYLMTANA